ncbi:MAG: thiamine pyrophosphate-dependent enzyme [Chloroflexota bacterium]|nr:thiamine pyrophosphate-dependent enzyme [Chloroflexota bacterium]
MNKELVVGIPERLHPRSIAAQYYTWCPGCHIGIIKRLICEVFEEIGIEGNTISTSGAGCASLWYLEMDSDNVVIAHGRATDGARAIKRLRPDQIVYCVEGDGDCIAIGAESNIAAATFGDKITVVMVNNAGYGATGGQCAPTTPFGLATSTTPLGRDSSSGYPVDTAKLFASVRGTAYSARGAVNTPRNYQLTKGYLKKAFQKQMDKVGFSFVEIISACPTQWHMSPLDSLKYIEEKMIDEYPLGEFKNVDCIE